MQLDAHGNQIPSAQGDGPDMNAQATGGVPGDNQQTQGGDVGGAQARINELTAKMREQERINQQYQQQLMEQQAQFAAQQAQMMERVLERQAPREQAPDFGEVDPQLRGILDYQQKQFQKQLEQMQKGFQQNLMGIQAQLAGQQVQQVAAQYGDEPAVVQEAQKLLQQYPNLGLDNALDVARGRQVKTQRQQQNAGQRELQQFNGMGAGMTGHRQPQPVQQYGQVQQQNGRVAVQLPPEANLWSDERKIQWLDDKIGDLPF